MKNRIVLNVPHSSINGIGEAGWRLLPECAGIAEGDAAAECDMDNTGSGGAGKIGWSPEADEELLRQAVYPLTDWHTNIIFRPDRNVFDEKEASMHVFKWSRFVVDVERLIDDSMEKIGQGIVYERFGDRLVRSVTPELKAALYRERQTYLDGIEANILANDAQGGGTVLVDCHSFPSYMSDVQVCIGFNDDVSKPADALLAGVEETVRKHGFKPGINVPYSNSLQPVSEENLSKLRHGYCTLMLEVNKSTYLVDGGITFRPEWTRLKACIDEIFLFLAGFDQNCGR